MKKGIFALILLLSVPACFKKKVCKPDSCVPKTEAKEWKKGGEAKFDEDAEEFYLEDEETGNVFDNTKEAKPASDLDLQEVDIDNGDEEVVQFDFDRTDIKPEEAPKIERSVKQIKETIKKNPTVKVAVKGHSCHIAKSKTYNYAISQERADKVKKEYVKQGVPVEKVSAVGYGDSQPITEAKGKEGQAPNRRAETKCIKN